MKKTTLLDIVTRLFIILITLIMLTVGVRAVVKNVLVDKFGFKGPIIDFVFSGIEFILDKNNPSVKWADIYPFEKEELPVKEASKPSGLSGFKALFDKIKPIFDSYTSTYLVGYEQLVYLQRCYDDLIDWNMTSYEEYNGVTELDDDFLVSYESTVDVSGMADNLIKFKEFCDDSGVGLMYVQAPSRISEVCDTSISGVYDFTNQNADAFLDRATDAGVITLDIRDYMPRDRTSYRNMFFYSDHHWKPETGLWASGLIADAAYSAFGLPEKGNRLDIDSFTGKLYEDWFLGSFGKKLTLARAKPDDITLLYPNYPTHMKLDIPYMDINAQGDFSITYDMSHIEHKDYNRYTPYDAYGWSNRPLIRFENSDAIGRVLVIKNSYGNCVTPFLSLVYGEVDAIDPRTFNGSIETYIKTTQPDAVIVLYHASVFNEGNLGLHKDCFDFR